MSYFVRISYDGTNYGGWQRQANRASTLQQTIEELLSETFSRTISIAGCGRTDCGVHATQFYFYLPVDDKLPENFVYFMNKKLPPDIAFHEVIRVEDNAHVCLDAVSRTYNYFFHDFPDASLARNSSNLSLGNFNPGSIVSLLQPIEGEHDFGGFCLTPGRQNSTVVDLQSATFYQITGSKRYRFQFIANRFLRGMIRILVNDLISVGKGEMLPQEFNELLAGKPRIGKVFPAPPQGLFLTAVRYPYLHRESALPFSGQCQWQAVD